MCSSRKWKASTATRVKTKQRRKAQMRPIMVDNFPEGRLEEVLFLPDDEDSSYVENSSQDALQIGIIRARSDRQLRNTRVRRR